MSCLDEVDIKRLGLIKKHAVEMVDCLTKIKKLLHLVEISDEMLDKYDLPDPGDMIDSMDDMERYFWYIHQMDGVDVPEGGEG